MNHAKHLRIAGLLEILLGAVSILAVRGLLSLGGAADATAAQATAALGGLTLLYVGYGFQNLAGLLGICLAGRRSLLTVILGVLLFVVQLVGFLNTSGMVEIVINIVLLVIPYYYLHNAYKIYRAK